MGFRCSGSWRKTGKHLLLRHSMRCCWAAPTPCATAVRALPTIPESYVVGEATALAAREAGFVIVASGSRGLQEVLDKATHPRLLCLAGEEHITLEPPSGITLTERITYASRPQTMPAALAEMLARPAVIMLHSAAAARYFTGECGRLGVERGRLNLAVIGPRVAEAAGPGWARIATAAQPSDHALLALASHLCQTTAF